ncbi:hypothetical protein MPS_4116 [Mycobacterium pseudoshottsii JCM 15466]|nr:hypothetical protein MPS_4116 [Mycobacterium pseudoshottsii JCM 15466]
MWSNSPLSVVMTWVTAAALWVPSAPAELLMGKLVSQLTKCA